MTPGGIEADTARDAIEAARRRPSSDKLRDGLRLFDRTCRVMADGIRHQHPGAKESEVLVTLRERLRLARHLEQR